MAGDKYLALVDGKEQEVIAVQSGGSGNANKIPALNASTGLLDVTMMPEGIGPEVIEVTATEALAAGALVNFYNSTGLKCRNANAAAGTALEAHGFVLAAVSESASATVYLRGQNTQLTGLTPGGDCWLGSTSGTVSQTPPGAGGAGTLSQLVGVATGATSMDFNRQRAIVMAS